MLREPNTIPESFQKRSSSLENLFPGIQKDQKTSMSPPTCLKCHKGQLVPLSDYSPTGAEIYFKAWVCTNPDCRFNLKIRNGEVFVDEPVYGPDTKRRPYHRV